MTRDQIAERLKGLEGWTLEEDRITKSFSFKNYYETVSFVNAAAWVAHREDHHPEIKFGYKSCRVSYWTHSIGGISENDFLCAEAIEALLD